MATEGWEKAARERDPKPGKYDAGKSGFRTPIPTERDPWERVNEQTKLAHALRDNGA